MAFFDRVPQNVPAAPDGLNVVVASGGLRELFTELADKNINDLEFRFVNPAVQMVEEHFLGQRRTFAEREQFQDSIFLTGQMKRLVVDFNGPCIEIDCQLTGFNNRLCMSLGTADNGLNTSDQFILVKRLGQLIVGADAEPFHFLLRFAEPGQDKNRRFRARGSEAA